MNELWCPLLHLPAVSNRPAAYYHDVHTDYLMRVTSNECSLGLTKQQLK